jgi:PQQ enzyme repeat/PQQ-like domain
MSRSITLGMYAALGVYVVLVQPGCGNDERLAGPPVIATALTSKYDWMQFGGDARHTSNNTLENTLTVQTVGRLKQLFKVSLPAAVQSAPVLLTGVSTSSGLRDLIFVDTASGDIVALDANTGATLWSHRNGGTSPTASSPAIDPSRGFVYAYGLDGKVHKYAVADGTETTTGGWPEVTTLKPSVEKGGSALTIATVNGTNYLYAPNGGFGGDGGDYQGHVTTINLGTGAQTIFNMMCSDQNVHLSSSPDCSGQKSALWAKAGVVYDSDTGRIYAVSGNGTYNPGSHFWGDSIVALHPDGTGINGGPLDSYTPSTFQALQDGDLDLGSTQPAILPGSGTKFPHIAVQSGKDAKLRIVNLDNLSGQAGPGHTAGELFSMTLPQGGEVQNEVATWVNPADGSTWVFVSSPGSGLAGLQLAIDGSGNPSLVSKWTVTGGSGGAVIANNVLYYPQGSSLFALTPTTGAGLWNAGIGAVHFQSPIVANGVVYIADDNSNLTAFSLGTGGTPVPAENAGTVVGVAALLAGLGLRRVASRRGRVGRGRAR